MKRTPILTLFITLLAITPAIAQKKKPKNKRKLAYLSAKKADADFKFQGEYSGELGGGDDKQKWGIQVIARGNGKFEAVGYPGGLPGDGWDGETKVKAKGERKGDTLIITSDQGTATIKDGVAAVSDPCGNAVGSLKRVVRKSKTLGKKPPKGAVVLYGGKEDAKNWKGGKVSSDGYLMQGITSKKTFAGPFKLHMEFLLSYMPHARGQGRSNSGVYMQGRYEVQILDSFGLVGKHNECGGIYETKDPKLNMCYPPLQWQTYDIEFTPAKYEGGKKTADARLTVWHNGVKVHDNVKVPKPTRASPVKAGAGPGPIYIQNHGNPLRFRNIWLAGK